MPQEYRAGYRDHWLACDLLEFTSHGYEGYLYDADHRRVDFEGYRVDCMAGFVIDYLRDYAARQSEKPFFLMASFIEPHQQNDLDRYVEQCLYDLDADPHERDNRVADPAWASVRAELAGRLKKRMVLAGESEPSIEPAE